MIRAFMCAWCHWCCSTANEQASRLNCDHLRIAEELLAEPPRKKSRKDLEVSFDLVASLKSMDSEDEDSGAEDAAEELDAFNSSKARWQAQWGLGHQKIPRARVAS